MYGAIIGDIVGSRFEFDRGDDTDALGAIAGAMARACILSKMPVWFGQNGSHRRSLWKWLKSSEVLLTAVHGRCACLHNMTRQARRVIQSYIRKSHLNPQFMIE